METKVKLNWMDNLLFEANIDEHKIFIDSHEGKEGPSPKKLLMVSLGGCTGMDVISIIKKMKVEFSKFYIELIGNINDEHPKKYNKIKIIYYIDASENDIEKIEKAINLSKDKYCGVWNTLAPSLEIEYSLKFIK